MTGLETGIGLDIVLWFQSWRGPFTALLAHLFDAMGSMEFYLVLLPFIYWCVDAAFGKRLCLLLLASMWQNAVFKQWWARPRPFSVSDHVDSLKNNNTYGLPSGHAQGAVTFWGMIGYRLKRRFITVVVILMVFSAGVFRLVMGVHYPQDVILGWGLGTVWLGGWLWFAPRIEHWLSEQKARTLIGLITGLAATGLLIQFVLAPGSPSATMEYAAMILGGFWGMGVGFVLETRFVGFNAGGSRKKRLLRFAIGLLVIIALRSGLKIAFVRMEPAMIFRMTRFSVVGFWVACGAPWFFIKTGLAGKSGCS